MDQSDFVPYAHSAAGHEGLSSNASGSLIIKPCTQAEIDFYESAKNHPLFQAHMPTYMGALTLNQDPSIQALAGAIGGTNGGATAVNQTTIESTSVQQEEQGTTIKGADKSWVPSGGKKLSTGLGIVLENATTGFTKPNVLDLKIGARLWADDSPESKRRKLDQVASETTTGSLGFRVAGMKVWLNGARDPDREVNTEIKDGYRSYDKFYGRTLTASTVSEAFVNFVGGGDEAKRQNTSEVTAGTGGENKIRYHRKRAPLLLKRLLRELQSIQYVVEQQESRMYSASVLVVIEGDDVALEKALEDEETEKMKAKEKENIAKDVNDDNYNDNDEEDDDEEEENLAPRVLEVRLIDFAHASWTPGRGPDENFLHGIRNAKTVVEDLLRSVP